MLMLWIIVIKLCLIFDFYYQLGISCVLLQKVIGQCIIIIFIDVRVYAVEANDNFITTIQYTSVTKIFQSI